MNKHPLHFARWSVILDNSNIKESAEEWTKVHSSFSEKERKLEIVKTRSV